MFVSVCLYVCVVGVCVSHATMVDVFMAADTKKICKKRTLAAGGGGQEGRAQFRRGRVKRLPPPDIHYSQQTSYQGSYTPNTTQERGVNIPLYRQAGDSTVGQSNFNANHELCCLYLVSYLLVPDRPFLVLLGQKLPRLKFSPVPYNTG